MGPWLVVQPASAAVPRVVWKPIMVKAPPFRAGVGYSSSISALATSAPANSSTSFAPSVL